MTVFVAYGHKQGSDSLVVSVYKAKAHASDNSNLGCVHTGAWAVTQYSDTIYYHKSPSMRSRPFTFNSGVGTWKKGLITLVPSENRTRIPRVNILVTIEV